jgi:hypothetical protein
MPEAGAAEQRTAGRAAQPLPVAARRRLWQSVWDRLLGPTPSERHGGDEPDQVDKRGVGRRPPSSGRRQTGEAA